MSNGNYRKYFKLGVVFFASAFVANDIASFAHAQDDEIVVTGTRRDQRSASDTPAPVDVISNAELTSSGDTDILNLLRNTVPAYNAQTQPINDAATLVRPANLRGLSSDHTLVLVNGKRRHRSSVITFLGNGLSDGSQGPDVSNIPNIALKQVEVLRDGASAQYGSDAIAGVINFILDDSTDTTAFETRYGAHYEGDGKSYYAAAKKGFNFNDNGFLTLAAEWRRVNSTSRSVQRSDAQALIDAGNNFVNTPAQDWGSPEIVYDAKVSANMAVSLDEDNEFYVFGNYADREVEGGFYYRNPNTRGGVFTADGGVTRLVGDRDLTNDIVCPSITIGSEGDLIATNKLASDAECFAFNEYFPGGFTPKFGGKINDAYLSSGFRGMLDSGLSYDLSYTVGRSEINFIIKNTVNASLGPDSPTEFKPGSYIQLENMVNADFNYGVEVDGFASPLNIAFGGEYRDEQFQVVAGDVNSWKVGDYASQGFSIGSNGFPGFSPVSAGTWDRANYSFYVDLEGDVTDSFTFGLATRFENYDDFGSDINGKLALLYKVSDTFRVRGTYSTGFRAPTPAQSNIINVSTTLDAGVLVNRGTVPVSSDLAIALGSPGFLEPEKSTSFTVGFGFDVGNVDVTVDYFNVEVEDRIAQSASFSAEQFPQFESQFREFNSDNVRFYTNDFDTKTKGFDVIATMPYDLGEGSGKLILAYNHTETDVTAFSDLISNMRIRQLEESLPNDKLVLTANYNLDKWSASARLNYYGDYFEALASAANDDGTAALPVDVDAMATVDVMASYQVADNYSVTFGADNLFDQYPTENPFGLELGNKYPETAPAGSNGGFVYVKLNVEF